MDWLIGKARGKSDPGRNSAAAAAASSQCDEAKLYVQGEFASQQIPMGMELDSLLEQPQLLQPTEWIATHLTGLHENVCTLYEAVHEFCLCEKFTGPGGVVYCSADDKAKKSRSLARYQIDSSLAQCQEQLAQLFPTRRSGHIYQQQQQQQDVPRSVLSAAGGILRRLLDILGHVYACHYDAILRLELVPHLNTVARHWFLFNAKFRLLDDRELESVAEIQVALSQT